MTGLSPEHKALLELARDADDPSDAPRERVRHRLAAQLGAGAGLTASATATTSAASSGACVTSVVTTPSLATVGLFAAKIVAIAAFAVGAGAGAGAIYRSAFRPVRVPADSNALAASALSGSPTPPQGPAIMNRGDVPVAIPQAAPIVEMKPSVAPHASQNKVLLPTVVTSVSRLEEEMRIVRAGDAALRSGNAASALALFDQHARDFPHGVLVEERAADRVLALCALGRELEASADAERFLRDKPNAPLAAKVRACM